MIWLTWRQFRAQAVVAATALAVLAIALAVTGPHLAHLYDASGIATCRAHGDCGTLTSNFVDQLRAGATYKPLFYLGIGVLFAAPAIIGAFWGAPLVTREIEAGTFRLAWSQSVTRTRWLAVKLCLNGLAAMGTAGLFSLMVTWWAAPIDQAIGTAGSNAAVSFSRLDPLVFAARGITPIGYAVFAFILGVTAGVIIRRTLPAMAITLGLFAAIQVAMPNWVRPHLFAPLQSATALTAGSINGVQIQGGGSGAMRVFAEVNMPGAWVLSNQVVDTAGHAFTGPPTQACQGNAGSVQACTASIVRLHLRQLVSYQPASRYWAFQWYETALFLALGLALAGFCFWRIRGRSLA